MTEGLNYLWPGPSAVSTVVGDRDTLWIPATLPPGEHVSQMLAASLLLFLALPLPLLARHGCHSER